MNVAKTKYMIFSKRNKNINPIYLNINNNVIEHVHQFNFLELHLNSRLIWNTHIEEISKKFSRTIGVLKKLQLTPQKKHTVKHIQCTYSATDKLLFAMLPGLRFFCDISLAKKTIRIISQWRNEGNWRPGANLNLAPPPPLKKI